VPVGALLVLVLERGVLLTGFELFLVGVDLDLFVLGFAYSDPTLDSSVAGLTGVQNFITDSVSMLLVSKPFAIHGVEIEGERIATLECCGCVACGKIEQVTKIAFVIWTPHIHLPYLD